MGEMCLLGVMRGRFLAALLLVAAAPSLADEAGRRGGGFLSTAGHFTMTASNRAGNEEDLGEIEEIGDANALDASPLHQDATLTGEAVRVGEANSVQQAANNAPQACERVDTAGNATWATTPCHQGCKTCDNRLPFKKAGFIKQQKQRIADGESVNWLFDGCGSSIKYKCTACRNGTMLVPTSTDGKAGACVAQAAFANGKIHCSSQPGLDHIDPVLGFQCAKWTNISTTFVIPSGSNMRKQLTKDTGVPNAADHLATVAGHMMTSVTCEIKKVVMCNAAKPQACSAKKSISCVKVCPHKLAVPKPAMGQLGDGNEPEPGAEVDGNQPPEAAAAAAQASDGCKTGKWCLPSMCATIGAMA